MAISSSIKQQLYGFGMKLLTGLVILTLFLLYGMLWGYSPLLGIGTLLAGIYFISTYIQPFWGTLAFVFTLAFADFLGLPITADGLKLSTIILITAFLIWALRALLTKDRDLIITPLATPAYLLPLVFLLISFISLVNSHDLGMSIGEIQKFIYCLFTFFLLVVTVKDEKQFKRVLNCFIISGAIVCLFGVVEGLWGSIYVYMGHHSIFGAPLPLAVRLTVSDRIDGFIGDPNFHGMYAGMVFMISLAMFVVDKYRGNRYLLVMLISLFNVIGAASRGPAFALGISFITFWAYLKLRYKWLIFLGLVTLIMLIFIIMIAVIPDLNIERFYKPEGKAKKTLQLRQNNAMIGLDMFLDNPLIGHGPGGFLIEYHKYSLKYPYAQKREIHPLNVYIQVLADYGTLGFVFLLSIIFIVLKEGFWLVRNATDDLRIFALSILSVFLGTLVYMNFSGRLVDQYFWLLMALIVSLRMIHRQQFLNSNRL